MHIKELNLKYKLFDESVLISIGHICRIVLFQNHNHDVNCKYSMLK